jgi:hypothetical protein
VRRMNHQGLSGDADDLNAARYESRGNHWDGLAISRDRKGAEYSHGCTIDGDELMTFQLRTFDHHRGSPRLEAKMPFYGQNLEMLQAGTFEALP